MRHSHYKPPPARCFLTALAATTILATTITAAHANRLSFSNQQVRFVWANLEFLNPVVEGTMRCPLTLEGSFHSRTIPKQRGLLVGYVTRAAVSNPVCTGGRATILQELLPWHLTYQSFSGTLPNITNVTLSMIRFGFILDFLGNNCRGLTTIASPFRLIASVGGGGGGGVSGIRIDESATIPLTNGPGGLFCSLASGVFRGTGRVTLLGNNNTVSITLI